MSYVRCASLLAWLAVGLGWFASSASGADPAPARQPWTTSRVTGSPEPPPPYRSARAFPNATFRRPLQIARCPGSERLFVTEQEGKIYSLRPGAESLPELFFDLPAEIRTLERTPAAKGLDILYGVAFHPQFEQNRFCYVAYALAAKDSKNPFLPDGSRISRFTVSRTEPPRIEPQSEEIVITWQGGGHNGCDLHFGPRDGLLYFSTGDGRGPNPPDPLGTGQDCSDLLSSLVRIDVDRRDPDKNYAVPADNPFVDVPGVRPELWAFGFRNPYRMSFDRQTGDLWVGDVGWESWELVHKIQKGGNYGWSVLEGRHPVKPDLPIGPAPVLPPTLELPHTIAASVTGGYVYRGRKFPELVGAYVFGDWETRRLWAARFEDGRVKELVDIVKPNIRVSAFGEDAAGEIYYADHDSGFLHALERNDVGGANASFPRTLGATGLFADVARRTPAAGVEPFRPAVTQWQDGATSSRFCALPGTSAVTVFDKPRKLPGQVYWHEFRLKFPEGAVLVKHLELDVVERGMRPVETQLLHFDGEDWRGYTYAWRDDGADADLVPAEGAERLFAVADPRLPGGRREVVWSYASRNQCLVCHNSWSEYALAFSLGQLNGPVVGDAAGTPPANELLRLSRLGLVQRVDANDRPLPPFDPESAARERAFRGLAATDSKEELDRQARSYLHVNCAHCHRFGGGGGQVVLEMDFSRPLAEIGLLDVTPRQGDFGIADAKIVKSGDPLRSVLFYRMAKFGRGRMPHLGAELPDPAGLDLVARWIASLGPAAPTRAPESPAENFASPDAALSLARRLARPDARLDQPDVRGILASAAALPAGPVRDLFEGYLPPDPRGRKLGAHPKPAVVLERTGDAQRGESLFFAQDLKCGGCHKVGSRGGAVGPELTTIGRQRTRAELLESLLQPSLVIEPKFAQYVVQTSDGKSHAGLLLRRDTRELVLRTAEAKDLTLAADAVELARPSRVSLMPEGLVAGLLPQEAADLLEYLATRR